MALQLLNNRNFLLILAFALGLIFSDFAHYTRELIIPILAVILTASITQVSIKDFFPLKNLLRPFAFSLGFNFIVLGILSLSLAWILLPGEFWVGYAIIAASPPGAAIMPFTYIRNGDITFSLMGTFTVYLSALVITPLMTFALTGGVLVSPLELFTTMVQIILIPFIVSQVLNKLRLTKYIEAYRGTIIKWGFFIVVFTVIGLNREVFFTNLDILVRIATIALITTFVLGALLQSLLNKTGLVNKQEARSLVLISTIKNMGFASAIALAFFEEIASIPAAITAAVYAIYFIFLGITANKSAPEQQ